MFPFKFLNLIGGVDTLLICVKCHHVCCMYFRGYNYLSVHLVVLALYDLQEASTTN